MPTPDITQLLTDWSSGDTGARDLLIEQLYLQLRRLAGHLRNQAPEVPLQTTELVTEAYLKLVDQDRVHWQNRAHFFAIAGKVLRRLIVDHLRHHDRRKRGGGINHVSLASVTVRVEGQSLEALALDQALEQLEKIDEIAARVVELRYFSGLSHDETAVVLGIGRATVGRSWRFARAWLRTRLGKLGEDGHAGGD